MIKIEKSHTICLCMIVKDEAHIIDKCLKSVAPLIDYYVICDTGSSDNTIDIINKTTSDLGLKGDILNHRWINFAHNRTLSLRAAKSKADYLLIIDADETLQFHKNKIGYLDRDAYNIETILGQLRYNRLQLLSTRLDWYYEGVVHEYPTAKGLKTIDKIFEFQNVSTVQGSRSKNPNKYLDDAKLLEEDLLTNKDNSRSVFYLAQSYRDAKYYIEARENYIKRLGMSGYDEELIVCYNQIGYCSRMLGDGIDTYAHYYLDGYKRFPHRLECLYEYIHCLKVSGHSNLAIDIGFGAALTPYPKNDSLFILKDIYDFLFRVELANCCINQGMYKEAIILLKYTLEYGEVPVKNKADIYTKILDICEKLKYTNINTTRPIEIVYNKDDLSKSSIIFNTQYTPINITYNTNDTMSVYLNNSNLEWTDNIDMEITKTLLDMYSVDLNLYLEVMKNDLKYIKQYKNIINFSIDIIILGEPSYEFLEKISRLVTDINRIFIFLYDGVISDDKSKLITNSWNLIIGNIGNVKGINSYVDITRFSGINDLIVGWVEIFDDRLTYLATP